jgi:hypothetical protein
LKNIDNENEISLPLIINNNQAYLIDNFDLIKQRYSSLADFNLSRGKILIFLNFFIENISDGKQLRITFKPHDIFIVLEAITNGRYGESWKGKIVKICIKFRYSFFLVIDSLPSLPSFTQLNTMIRQSNNLTAEHLCLIRACLLKQQKLNE